MSPERLTAQIITFLDTVWTPARRAASGRRRRAERTRNPRSKPALQDRTGSTGS
jgi:hypothetical protein